MARCPWPKASQQNLPAQDVSATAELPPHDAQARARTLPSPKPNNRGELGPRKLCSAVIPRRAGLCSSLGTNAKCHPAFEGMF